MITFSDETCCTDSECEQWPNRHRCEGGVHGSVVLADGSMTDDGMTWFLCAACLKAAEKESSDDAK